MRKSRVSKKGDEKDANDKEEESDVKKIGKDSNNGTAKSLDEDIFEDDEEPIEGDA